jgi:SAM-dependent methyltransferase/putative flippase GtrA
VAAQFYRYAFVGVVTNVAAYLLYLGLTFWGLEVKIAATVSFVAVVILGFGLNRNVTFQNVDDPRITLRRYVVVYAIAYLSDIAGLHLFATLAGYTHEIVQLVLIVIIAGGLFVAQKFWVFAGDVGPVLAKEACLPTGRVMAEVRTIDGIPCYAPELALGSEDYPTEFYDRLCRLEESHFWFRARNRIILREFAGRLGHLPRPRVLEIGCGTGYVLHGLAAKGVYDLTGAEVHIAGLLQARRRLPSVEFVQADARDLPYEAAFDAVGAFDVIEHISEDEQVLMSVHRALKPGGLLFLTVPQHKWLWSAADEQARHKRRYERGALQAKLKRSGFTVLRATSFVTVLLPILWASRRAKRGGDTCDIDWSELEITRGANTFCAAAMRIDEALIAAGISLPAGGSLFAVARKSAC